jgi:outer membrane lipoprotein-sorting protein
MNRSRRFAISARWAVPAAAVAAVGMVIAGSMVAGAQASPALPARTAAQLLADIARAPAPPSSLSGVIVQSASLGLPQLPDAGGRTSAESLLAGSHTIKFWYAGPAHVRYAIPATLGESDLRRAGRQVWLWDSSSQTATHIVLPARSGRGSAAMGSEGSYSGGVSLTPQQAARQVLAAVGPTTTVSVQQNVMVAGQAAYQLAIAPRDSRSMIGQIRIAVDAHRYLPLRLQVFARGATSPAYQVGFTALSFARPAASNFTFTPPPGAKVKNIKPGAGGTGFRHVLLGGLPPGAGSGFDNRTALRNQPSGMALLPAPRAGRVKRVLRIAAGRRGVLLPKAVLRPGVLRPGASAGSTVIGKGWLSVLVLPSAGLSPSATTRTSATYSSKSAAYSSTEIISAPVGQDPAALRALLAGATPVHGSWGSGRLLRTSLLSVLFTNSGHVLIGAVTPSVLYADAAKVK